MLDLVLHEQVEKKNYFSYSSLLTTEGKAASHHSGTYCSQYPFRPSGSNLGDEMKIILIKFAVCLQAFWWEG